MKSNYFVLTNKISFIYKKHLRYLFFYDGSKKKGGTVREFIVSEV